MKSFRLVRLAVLASLPIGMLGLLAAGCSTPRSSSPPAPRPAAAPPELAPFVRHLAAATPAELRGLARTFNIGFEPDGEPRFHLLVKAQRPLKGSPELVLGARFGGIVSVYATRAGLAALEAQQGVRSIEPMRRMRPSNDVSTTRSSLVTRAPQAPASQLTIPFTGGSIVLPYTPLAANKPITFKLSKMGPVGPERTVVQFASTLTVCAVSTVPCPAPLATATANDAGGDAKLTYAFTTTAPASLQLSGVGTPGAGQPASVDVALTVIGDSRQGFPIGTAARDTSLDGTGVVVADVDTGIDFCHPDFIDPETGKSRILYLWDQGLTPIAGEHSPAEPELAAAGGVEYTQADINASLASCAGGDPSPVRSRDVDAHGTHTAGTAAGNGGGTPYIGAAPKADLIVVKGLGSGITVQHLPEALLYALVRARARGEPVAINNSWGSYGDGLDGRSALEEAVSSVAGRGSIAIFAAGNSSATPMHATSTTPPAAIGADDPWYLRNLGCVPGTCEARPVILWTDPADAYTLTLTDDAGTARTWTPAMLTAAGTAQTLGTAGTGGAVSVTASADLSPSGRYIFINIPAAASVLGPRAESFWTVNLVRAPGSTGTGVWDAYAADGALAVYDSVDSPAPPDPPLAQRHVTRLPNGTNTEGSLFSTYTPGQLCAPSTGFGVVAVGAVATNLRWLDNTAPAPGGYNEPVDTFLSFNTLGNYTYFSSRGPSRDGRPLPHVGAPGLNVISTLSRFAVEPPESIVFNPSGPTGPQHFAMSGTSMATPNVTGAAALMLQADPTNFPRPLIVSSSARDLLTDEATSLTGVPPQGWFGAGKVDVASALASLATDVPPLATRLTASPPTVAPGGVISFTVAASDADGTVDEYLWDVNDDGFTEFFTHPVRWGASGNSLTTTAPLAEGEYAVRVIVVDNFGKTASALASYVVMSGASDGGVEGSPGGGVSDASADGSTGGGIGGGTAPGADSDAGPLVDAGSPVDLGGAPKDPFALLDAGREQGSESSPKDASAPPGAGRSSSADANRGAAAPSTGGAGACSVPGSPARGAPPLTTPGGFVGLFFLGGLFWRRRARARSLSR